jgi:glycosyltransferase involved in cell wall biosynthesis
MERKPRGMMVIHNYRPGPMGGTELQAERLAAKMVELGHSMHVMTSWSVAAAPREEMINGVQIHRMPFQLAYFIREGGSNTFRFLVKKLKNYDIIHCHMAYGHAVVAVIVARCFRKKCVIKIACTGEYGELYDISRFEDVDLGLEILHQADSVIAISRDVEEDLLHYGFSSKRIIRIPNGVDTEKFKRNCLFPSWKKIRFLITGRRHPQKGIDVMLNAVKNLKDRGFAERFEVKSYGLDLPGYDYRQMARELDVADLVEFLPFNQNMLEIYPQVHAFILPSRGEGLSNALLEAMSMELPVVVSRVSGMTDVVEDGEDGMLIPCESIQALTDAMIHIINEPEFALRLGQNARRKMENGFSLDSVARQYSDLYKLLCG